VLAILNSPPFNIKLDASSNHIITLKIAEEKTREFNGTFREVNSARGTQFFNVHGGRSKFQKMLEGNGI